jgi:hypothetical protein
LLSIEIGRRDFEKENIEAGAVNDFPAGMVNG